MAVYGGNLKYGTCHHRATELTNPLHAARPMQPYALRAHSCQRVAQAVTTPDQESAPAPHQVTKLQPTLPDSAARDQVVLRGDIRTSPAALQRTHYGSQNSQGRSCRTVHVYHGRASYPVARLHAMVIQHVPSGPGVIPGLRDSTPGDPGGERRIAAHSHRATMWADGPGAERLALTLL